MKKFISACVFVFFTSGFLIPTFGAPAYSNLPFSAPFKGQNWKFPKNSEVSKSAEGDEIFSMSLAKSDTEGARISLNASHFNDDAVFIAYIDATLDYLGEKNYEGVKFQVSYMLDGNMVWIDAHGLSGKKDLKNFRAVCRVKIPKNAQNATLLLGLQNAKGKVSFKNLKVASLEEKSSFEIPENFKCEYSEKLKNSPRLRGFMSPVLLKASDIRDMSDWGANVLRFQLNRHWNGVDVNRDIAEFSAWVDEKIAEIKKVSALASQLGVRIIVDMHTPVGGRFGDKEMRMFHEKQYADAFVEIWRKIALSLKGDPAVFAYDLINEPLQNSPAEAEDFLSLQYRAALAIRQIDSNIPIIVAANNWDSPDAFETLKPLPLRDIIYQVHMYVPFEYTHQKVHKQNMETLPYPLTLKGVRYDSSELERVFKHVIAFQEKYGAKIYAGEFSAIRWAPNADKYISDCIEIFEKYNWDWSYHAFREWQGWSVEVGENYEDSSKSLSDTKRKLVLLKAFEKNKTSFKAAQNLGDKNKR